MLSRATLAGRAPLLLAVLALQGCGGRTSHTVSPGTTGSLAGVAFRPADHSLDVDQDRNPRVYWQEGYLPPGEFSLTLRKVNLDSTKESVFTELREAEDRYEYELAPYGSLDAQSIYFITVSADDEVAIGMFLTGGTPPDNSSGSESKAALPPGAKAEHRVVVRQAP